MPYKKFVRRPRRKMAPRRRAYRPRMVKGRSLHSPKSFTSTFSLTEVIASPYGTHSDGFSRNLLSVKLTDIPIFTNLWTLYSQFAITSVKIMYKSQLNNAFSGPGGGAAALANILYAEDKDSDTAITPKQLQSQDNCRNFTSSRGFTMFTKKPRPLLYQSTSTGGLIKVISKSKDIHWLTPANSVDDPAALLPHVFGQMCVEDITGATADTGVGELWIKVYLAVKEQRKQGAI